LTPRSNLAYQFTDRSANGKTTQDLRAKIVELELIIEGLRDGKSNSGFDTKLVGELKKKFGAKRRA
jgi:hypothetical protein